MMQLTQRSRNAYQKTRSGNATSATLAGSAKKKGFLRRVFSKKFNVLVGALFVISCVCILWLGNSFQGLFTNSNNHGMRSSLRNACFVDQYDYEEFVRTREDLLHVMSLWSPILENPSLWDQKEQAEGFFDKVHQVAPWLLASQLKNIQSWNSGNAVVLCAGEAQMPYLVSLLNSLCNVWKTRLLIFLTYAGDEDLSLLARETLQNLCPAVQFLDLSKVFDLDVSSIRGWNLKPFALLAVPFENVVFIDVDAVLMQSPEIFFAQKSFRSSGALFFRDRLSRYSAAEGGFHVDCFLIIAKPEAKETEAKHFQDSGVIVLNKKRCLKGLLSTAIWLGSPSVRAYAQKHFAHGDKEFFFIGFETVNQSYSFSQTYPGAVGSLVMHEDSLVSLARTPEMNDTFKLCGRMLQFDDRNSPLWFNGGYFTKDDDFSFDWLEAALPLKPMFYVEGGHTDSSDVGSWQFYPEVGALCLPAAADRAIRAVAPNMYKTTSQAMDFFTSTAVRGLFPSFKSGSSASSLNVAVTYGEMRCQGGYRTEVALYALSLSRGVSRVYVHGAEHVCDGQDGSKSFLSLATDSASSWLDVRIDYLTSPASASVVFPEPVKNSSYTISRIVKPLEKSEVASWVARFQSSPVNEIWTTSTMLRQLLSEAGLDKNKLYVMPLALQCELFLFAPPAAQVARNSFNFFSVVPTDDLVALSSLLQAFLKAFKDDSSVSLHILPTAHLKSEAMVLLNSAALGSRLTIYNAAKKREVIGYHLRFDAYVNTWASFRGELDILEAMGCGLPVLIPSIWSTRNDLFADKNDFSILIQDATESELIDSASAAMKRLSANPGLASRMGRIARETILQRFCDSGSPLELLFNRLDSISKTLDTPVA